MSRACSASVRFCRDDDTSSRTGLTPLHPPAPSVHHNSCTKLCGLSLLEEKLLEQFEIAQMVNLEPRDADEAQTLVPSLKARFEPEDVKEFIDELEEFAQTQ